MSLGFTATGVSSILTNANCRPKVLVANIVSNASSVTCLKKGKFPITKIAALNHPRSSCRMRCNFHVSKRHHYNPICFQCYEGQECTYSSTTRWSISITGSLPCLDKIVFVILNNIFQGDFYSLWSLKEKRSAIADSSNALGSWNGILRTQMNRLPPI